MFQIARIKKLGTAKAISASAGHTFRERHTPNADPARLRLNTIVGPRSAAALGERLAEHLVGIKKGKDDVRLVEYLITASPEFFDAADDVRQAEYFDAATQWLKDKHGAANVLCTVIHRDEKTPHLVAYVVPVVEVPGGTRKRSVNAGGGHRKLIEVATEPSSKLSAKTFFDGSEKLAALQTDFHAKVAQKFGLERGVEGSKARHEDVKRWYGDLERQSIEAKRVIDQADAIKTQHARDAEKLRVQSAKLAIQAAELEAKETRLMQLERVLTERANRLVDAFRILPTKLQDQLAKIFGMEPPKPPVAPTGPAEGQKRPVEPPSEPQRSSTPMNKHRKP
jgi:hypothetical protein